MVGRKVTVHSKMTSSLSILLSEAKSSKNIWRFLCDKTAEFSVQRTSEAEDQIISGYGFHWTGSGILLELPSGNVYMCVLANMCRSKKYRGQALPVPSLGTMAKPQSSVRTDGKSTTCFFNHPDRQTSQQHLLIRAQHACRVSARPLQSVKPFLKENRLKRVPRRCNQAATTVGAVYE